MNPYDVYQAGIGGLEAGRQQGTQNRLARLVSQGMTAAPEQRQGLLAQIAQSSPDAALNTRKMFRDMDQDGVTDLATTANQFLSIQSMGDEAATQQAYANLAAKARAVTGAPIPDKFDQRYLAGIQKMAGVGAPDMSERYRVVGSSLVDLQNPTQAVYSAPDKPQNAVFQTDANGVGWWLAPGQPPQRADMPGQPQQQIAPGGAMPAPTTGAGPAVMGSALQDASPQGVQSLIQGLAGQFGGQVSSLTRSPAHNGKVGGVPNSQHIAGTAGDVVFTDPQAKARYIDAARRAGLEVIDEGDHVHSELPPGGRQVAQVGGGINFAKPTAADKPSALQEKLDLAQRMGATPEQLKQMVMGETGGGKPSATQLKLAATAKGKLIDLKAIDDQLARVEAAFSPLKDSFSATPYIGGLIPSEDGKKFDGAVSLLQGMVRKLTRTPGEGAMSDYETKLAQLANPSRSEYESVTGEQIEQLRALIQTTRQGYEALLEDAGGNPNNLPGRQPSPASQDRAPSNDIDSLLEQYR